MKMHTMLRCILIGMLTVSVANAEFTMPDEDAMKALVQRPGQIGTMIADASEQQSAAIIIQAISLMQAEGFDTAAIQAAMVVMFQKTAEVHGPEFGSAVVSIVRKRVNPRLLPIIRIGSTSSPKYTRQ
jgi:hypothetical protein